MSAKRNHRRLGVAFARLFASALAAMCLASPGPGAGATMTVGVKHNISATLIVPDGSGPFPGALILSTSGGVANADIAYAQRLAGEGFVCLVPAYIEAYHLVGPHGPINPGDAFTVYAQQIHDDLIQSANALRHQEKANGRIGVVGFSAGGFFAVWLALTQEIQAGVSYYGSFQGGPARIARFKGLVLWVESSVTYSMMASCRRSQSLLGGEFLHEPGEVIPRELPLKRLGHLLISGLEGQHAGFDLARIREIIGRQHFALHNAKLIAHHFHSLDHYEQ